MGNSQQDRAPANTAPRAAARTQLQLWGGVECSVTRVGDEYLDQLEWTGHVLRRDDAERLAQVGFTHVRFPVLWERVAPHGEATSWQWCDEQLAVLRDAGITPILGLLHHGSGPRHTSLVDPAFPELFARFAAAVAERYPWVRYATPINEPLTTARFSGLYGHWFPHGRSNGIFARALLNQIAGTRAAMDALRAVAPEVQLVQTEDLGKVYGTSELQYQADFENERRWLTFDLLSGRVDRDHPLHDYLLCCGIAEAELDDLVERPCPPGILGINHYVTSERFLDHRVERYPLQTHGGNDRHRYADVEAVRVQEARVGGHDMALSETLERYSLPVAITEAHLGCTREQQLRWLQQAWNTARKMWNDGHDVRGVAVWSLFGNYGWNELLTSGSGSYEPGVFDVRGSEPRRTALHAMSRSLATTGSFDHPVLQGPGWWRTNDRVCYAPAGDSAAIDDAILTASGSPILITGAGGTLGRALARVCQHRKLAYVALDRRTLDIADPAQVRSVLARFKPWALVNAAGYVRVDDAEHDRDSCFRINTAGPEVLARECALRDVRMVTFSTDLVFDGARREPYHEDDGIAPLCVYGASKAAAEAAVARVFPNALIVRTSAFFGPWDVHNFLTIALRSIAAGDTFVASGDMVVSPTYVPDLVDAVLDLLIDGESGIWHMANAGETSWADFAREAARRAGLDERLVDARPRGELMLRAVRPDYSALRSARATLLPTLDAALDSYLSAVTVERELASV